PRRSVRVLEVRHEHVRAGVQRVDHHLPLDGAVDLDAAVEQVVRQRRDLPVARADLGRVRKEGRELAAVDLVLDARAALEQRSSLGLESAREAGDELEGVAREDRVRRASAFSEYLN